MNTKKVLVLGATGNTGKLVVEQLLQKGHHVKAIVRKNNALAHLSDTKNLECIEASILEIPIEKLEQYVRDCDAIVSCLGHNLTVRGIWGNPRRLVTKSVRNVLNAIQNQHSENRPVFILMNTAGNRIGSESISFPEKVVMFLIRMLVPPHSDNEQAARVLMSQDTVEWVVVRPDTLTNADAVGEYDVYDFPIRSALFNPGKTSRITVAHFMTELIVNDTVWKKWRNKAPVIYNKE